MGSTELENLLNEDPLSKDQTFANEQTAAIKAKYAQQIAEVQYIQDGFYDHFREIWGIDLSDTSNFRKVEKLLGVEPEELTAFHELTTKINEEVYENVDKPLLEKGHALVNDSPIIKLEVARLPASNNKPYVLAYMAPWHPSCRVMTPALAQLSHYFTKGKIFYLEAPPEKQSKDVKVNQLKGEQQVGYFSTLVSHVGKARLQFLGAHNTSMLWYAMNELVDRAKSYINKDYLGTLAFRKGAWEILDGPLTIERIRGE